jgi:hypothetical protein
MRPRTLAAVAERAAQGDSFDLCLADFLDAFYVSPAQNALADRPDLLASSAGEPGRVRDAYLAATAVELARRFGLEVPVWTWSEERRLHRPWFASPLAGLRAVLLLESPAAFRERNLFVSENALTRA